MINDTLELERVRITLRQLARAACDTHETGFVTVQYKRQLVEMKWFLDDLIDSIGYFAGEEQWDQERTMQILQRKNNGKNRN